MQENEFEKQVQQKMEEFALLPKEDVWQNVAARIGKEKKRRSVIIWMIAGFLLAGGASAWWYVESDRTSIIDNSLVKETNRKETEKETNLVDTNKQNVAPLKLDKTATTGEQTHPASPSIKQVDQQTVAHAEAIPVHQKNRIEQPSAASKKPTINTSEENKQPYKTDQRKEDLADEINRPNTSVENAVRLINKPENGTVPLHKFYKTSQQLLDDSIRNVLAQQQMGKPFVAPTEMSKDKVEQAKKVTASKHWQPGFTFYGGLSDNVKGVEIVGAKSLSRDASAIAQANAVLQANGSYSTSQSAPALQYKSEASFGVGAFAKRQLTTRTAITAGVSYHYFSTSSSVGNKGSSSPNVYDTALSKQASATSFYGVGNTTSFNNKYHLIELPIDFAFRLNKNIDKPFVFSLGLSPSFLIASHALYLNQGARIYYTEKNQFKSFMLFGQSAIMFTAMNARKYSISAGPAFQYDFNSFSKWQTGTNQHLLFTGIKTNMIFK